MAKNNHKREDLEDALNESFYQQFSGNEKIADNNLEKFLSIAAVYASTESAISVLSDLKERRSYIFYGHLGESLGIAKEGSTKVLETIWEEEILCRLSEEDLFRKQAEEMKFFSFVKKMDNTQDYFLMSSFYMKDNEGKDKCIRHRIKYFNSGKMVRYALCIYNAACSLQDSSWIVNSKTGEETPLYRIDSSGMLTSREKEILSLISDGLSSKEIASRLGISLFTVSRHRQNIISSMNVKNSSQACQYARQLGLI